MISDKIGFEHVTPISVPSRQALARARKKVAAIGDTWVLPAARHLDRPCPKGTLDKWFAQAVEIAGVKPPPRARWAQSPAQVCNPAQGHVAQGSVVLPAPITLLNSVAYTFGTGGRVVEGARLESSLERH